MTSSPLIAAALCLLPVLSFLTALYYLDSYQLVRPTFVVALLVAGVGAAALGYGANGALLARLPIDSTAYTRYVSPLIEEALKGAIVVFLLRRHRIGFLVDAAVSGFAIGCGFALAENLVVLWHARDAVAATWIVRGFGTAIMHGGATATIAVVALAVTERHERHGAYAIVAGFAAAVLLHSAFNHLAGSPKAATLAVLLAVPALLGIAFHLSERALGEWLGHGFDADAEMLALLHSGRFSDAPVGRYLADLRTRFHGPIVADLLCYLGLFTELALRAKGLAIMREHGIEPPLDAASRAKLEELRYLERSIGVTGLVALHPLLPMRRKALSQLHRLGG